MQSHAKIKKAVSIAVTVLAVLIFAFAACIFALSVYAKSNGKQAALFGYSFSVVLTDSMTPEIAVGELVIVKHCSIERAELGDNAVYIAQSGPLEGNRIIHKVEKKGVDENGNAYIQTRGVKQGATLDAPVYAEAFVGIGVYHSAFLGGVVRFFSNTWNWVFLAVFLFGIWLGVRQIRKLISYAKPENAESIESDAEENAAQSSQISETSRENEEK